MAPVLPGVRGPTRTLVRMVVEQNPDVAYALADQKARLPFIRKRRAYYAGRHGTIVPDAGTVRNPDLRDLLLTLSDNMCDDVVDETVDRLEVVAWTSTHGGEAVPANRRVVDETGAPVDDGPEPVEDALGEAAQQVWDENRGPARERATYRDALTTADGWALVEKGRDNVWRWFPQDPEHMGCRYREDMPDVIDVAWKVWLDTAGKRWRLNLYYGADAVTQEGTDVGRLERYATRGLSPSGGIPEARAFLPLAPAAPRPGEVEDDGLRPDWDRNPVFHYPALEVGGYGQSVLTDVIPLQDVLNVSLCNLVVNGEDVALPQRFATGVQAQFDPVTGEDKPVAARARRASDMVTTANKDANFGQFPAADLTQHIAILEGLRAEIARKGYLPSYSTNGGDAAATGLSLLVQEGRQVKRCKSLARDWGWVHAELVAFLLRRKGGQFAGTQASDLDPEWANPATRDEQATWELLALKSGLGVPRERLLVEGGYSPDEAREWTEAKAAEAGGRVGLAAGLPGVASITQPGVPGGLPIPSGGLPVQPGGAASPGVAGAGALG